jgi:hypothetical protein
VLALVVVASAAGCGHSIGDGCSTNTDCSANGDRTCDLSQPGGYCTVEGCDQTSCPSDSACVRFFPTQFLSQPCNPACEDTNPPPVDPINPVVPTSTCPARMPVCEQATNYCSADQTCLPVGLCAPRAQEQRLCVKTCGGNGDCRGGYECRAGGIQGSVPLLSDPCGTVSFCAPLAK